MKNYSRQREAILNVLCSTKTHPTALWIYEQVQKEIPNISLGTVYRNLTGLVEDGTVKKLSFGETSVHFDGDCSVHSHFYCESCKSITDIRLDPKELLDSVEDELGAKIKCADLNIIGQCKNCCSKKN